MTPSISIIIPTLNEAAIVADAVQRARACHPHEVIVVDGGSADRTCEILREGDCRLLHSARGRALQQNLGAQQSTGDVLLFLHADNWLDPAGLGQITSALDDPRVEAGCFRQRIESPRRAYRVIEWGNALRASWLRVPYGDQAIFIRRQLFEAVGRFPEVPLMEDVMLMRQVRRRTRLALLPGPLHVSPRRWQQQGLVRQTLRNWILVTAAMLGVSPRRLGRFYPPHDATQAENDTP